MSVSCLGCSAGGFSMTTATTAVAQDWKAGATWGDESCTYEYLQRKTWQDMLPMRTIGAAWCSPRIVWDDLPNRLRESSCTNHDRKVQLVL